MFINFFYELRDNGISVTIKEYLLLMEALKAGCASYQIDDFYYLARSVFVKDETKLDRFDKVFGKVFDGIEFIADDATEIPEEWLRKMAELYLSEEEMAAIESQGGFEELMKKLQERLDEQKERHQGGNKWIGTAGTSPFGAHGYNPEGVRIGQEKGRHGKAIKVWDKREFKNLDDTIELGTRNIKVALRKLRQFAREGEASELDLDDTIKSTAHKGYLDIKMVPERHNAVKVLIFFDIGGSMDPHIKLCEELFSAARSEFKHLEFFYFHNCLYENVWKDNVRRNSERLNTMDILHTYPHDYKVIFVGDASMSPYEIVYPGGSVEHWNEEAGEVWLKRVLNIYSRAIWLNPIPEQHWTYGQSIQMMKELMEDRMFPLTVSGIDSAVKELRR
ncbi:VWA domain-containing protein [Temperatibacter marinus]|uniref:VWA domain-containing protein n=1 Tax=Temperatibacter marinus TaxID=1456591 RepID=A0AA52EHA2_9PROT|nr:VWA domain-containing protein [Temperatibacter marinus]WND02502.1 VWA domain-containing protein [Temperatibacter marinus]